MATPYNFLDAVNKTLKRVGVIQGDTGALTDFTEAAHQTDIDVAMDVWNELIHELYSRGLFKGEIAQGTITLLTSTTTATTAGQGPGVREYSLATDFERMAGTSRETRVLSNAAKGLQMGEYPGGYERMIADQTTASDYAGQSNRFAISPITGNIRIEADPQSGQSSDAYTYLYDKRLFMSATGDTFPFSDTVVDSLNPAAAQLWKRDRKKEFDAELFNKGFNRAMAYLTQTQPRNRYAPRRG